MSRQLTSKKVAVIGAGASGLVAARDLRKEGHNVVVFELVVSWAVFGFTHRRLSQTRLDSIVHCSLYSSLRTNLPREVMGFRDFPFVRSGNFFMLFVFLFVFSFNFEI